MKKFSRSSRRKNSKSNRRRYSKSNRRRYSKSNRRRYSKSNRRRTYRRRNLRGGSGLDSLVQAPSTHLSSLSGVITGTGTGEGAGVGVGAGAGAQDLHSPGRLAARKLSTMDPKQSEALLEALGNAPHRKWKKLLANWKNWEEGAGPPTTRRMRKGKFDKTNFLDSFKAAVPSSPQTLSHIDQALR